MEWVDGPVPENTDNSIPGVSETRCRPGAPFISPPGVHLERNAGAIAKPLVRSPLYAKVAFLSDTPQEQRGSCTTITGRHRCAEADLVIVPDLSILHDADALARSPDLVVCLLYMVSLGLDITTQKQWGAARGVRNLQPLACVRHVPLCRPANGETKFFRLGSRLKTEQQEVSKAFRRIMLSPNSKFIVCKADAAPPGAVCLDNLRQVVSWACSVRRTLNELGPKTYGVDGAAMPT